MRRTVTGFVIGVLFVGPLTFMLADREPPFYRDALDSKIVPDRVHVDQEFEVHWSLVLVNGRRCVPVGLVQRMIIDSTGKINSFEPVPSIADAANQRGTLVRQLRMPMGVSPGPARYHAESCFACNIVQYIWPVCIRHPDISFTILRRDEQ